MVDEVFEGLPGDRHAELSHMREITLRLMAWQVDLGKENFPRLSLERPPDFDFPLHRAQLPFLELPGMLFARVPSVGLRDFEKFAHSGGKNLLNQRLAVVMVG